MSKLWSAQEAELSASSEFKSDKLPEESNCDRIRTIKTLWKLPFVNHVFFLYYIETWKEKALYYIFGVVIQQNDCQTSNKLIPDQDHVKLVIFPNLLFFSE